MDTREIAVRVLPGQPAAYTADGEVTHRFGLVATLLAGDLYLIRGEVSAIEDGEITLDLADRQVRVQLDGHANPVGYQQPAEVHGRLIG